MNRSRGHVLVEAPERDAHARRVALELAGYETRWCPGPDDCDGTTCGLVSEHRCALADWADVVVNALGVQRSNNR
ncbi:MAG TPA: hypothetical protein VE991_05730, partial [Acidimicrobiales bacterium]|nr:hypothetical protein [Acidimicrobiales bacterium]